MESDYYGLLNRLFFGRVKRVTLRAYISVNKFNAYAEAMAVYDVYADGRTETVEGFPDLKDLYLKLKERFFKLRDERTKKLLLAKSKIVELIMDEI